MSRKPWYWQGLCAVHRWDYERLLPWMAGLPLAVGYRLSALRGLINAWCARDWRSMALQTRHILRMSRLGAQELMQRRLVAPNVANTAVRERFAVEARDEFEAQLMSSGRFGELHCRFDPPDAPHQLRRIMQEQGVVLLTPHFDSFYLGIAFLARAAGITLNAMASAVPADSRVDPAVTRHFDQKYRGLETALNGGRVIDMERGLRPFYRILRARQGLVVLADAPVLPGGAEMKVTFLGTQRLLAGGPLRLAAATGAAVAAFTCRQEQGGQYVLQWCDAGPPDIQQVNRLYSFLSAGILQHPGRWWALDLLPNLPPTEDGHEQPRGTP